jgi:AraC-like DNA-binding protein/quercetin dioxygenase-like cupin family protein
MAAVCGSIILRSPSLTPNVAANMPIAVFLPARPESSVDALAFDVQAGMGEPLHVHPCEGLLIYAEAGAFNLFTEDRVWALLPSRAIWLPPGVPSGWQAGLRAPVRLRPLHFPLPLPANLPAEPRVIGVSALLAGVIEELRRLQNGTAIGDDPELAATIAALRQVAFHEICRSSDTLLLSVPQPKHPGLRKVTSIQLADLAVEWPLPACAAAAHMSVRTFCRTFPHEADGLTWPAWVRLARMLVGHQLIELGASVNQAAAQVGYDSQSAFAAAYRRVHGASPSAHVGRPGGTVRRR